MGGFGAEPAGVRGLSAGPQPFGGAARSSLAAQATVPLPLPRELRAEPLHLGGGRGPLHGFEQHALLAPHVGFEPGPEGGQARREVRVGAVGQGENLVPQVGVVLPQRLHEAGVVRD